MQDIASSLSLSETLIKTISGVIGNTDQFVPLHEPLFQGNEWDYVKECLDTGWVSSVGSYVDRFEKELAIACGVKHAVCVVNGTAALHVSLLLAGVEAGDEVLIPALTFAATANAVAYVNAVPHLVESNASTLGLDPEKLDYYLAEISEVRNGACFNKKTGNRIACVVPMHVFGHSVDMLALEDLSKKWHIPIVEDAAEALGSTYMGKPLGSFGSISALSFNGNKIMTTGGGGAILTNNDAFAKQAKHLTTTAKVPHPWDFEHDCIGFNYRMPNINAALGCAQLEQLGSYVEHKRALAHAYEEAFENVEGVSFAKEPQNCVSNYWLNAILLDESYSSSKETVLKELNGANIMSRPVWKLMHRLPMFKNVQRMDLSIAQSIEDRLINIPSSVNLGIQLK